jgi:hypothetical protein
VSPRKLDKAEWSAFLESLTREFQGARAEIYVMSLAIGAQVQAEWRAILGLAYDEKDDVVEVALDGLDHLIPKPAEIFFDAEAGMLGSLEIIDQNQLKQIVKFKQALALPHGGESASRIG